MRNVQVIDGATNSEYAIFAFEDYQFAMIFPEDGQDIAFIEDVIERLSEEDVYKAFQNVWSRKIEKEKVFGIHGTLFYELTEKKKFYPNNKASDIS